MIIQPIRSLSLPARKFTPLAMSSYDQLPEDIMLIGAFRHLMDLEQLSSVFDAGLEVFPHLTGSIDLDKKTIITKESGVNIELANCETIINTQLLEQMSIQQLKENFMPDSKLWYKNKSLFGARVVHFPNSEISLLGIRASHCVVDGAGLALYLRSCMLSLSGQDQIPVFHHRNVLHSIQKSSDRSIPDGYQVIENESSNDLKDDCAKSYETTIFTLPVAEVITKWQASSLLDARIRLAAWLSAQCSTADPQLSELAVWCDVRGLLGLSPNYTGNCGCFLHYPLSRSTEEMTDLWRSIVKRKGFKKVATVFSQLQAHEAANKPLQWIDAPHVLQINIVPHSIAHVDFGYGKALFGMILARNSSGIRISITPDEQYFLLEIELSQNIREHLIKSATSEPFSITLLGQGLSVN